MANYATLKTAIQQVVKTNGNNEITGALLQQTLLAMINSLGVGYQYMGMATPSTNPGTPDQNVFYFATEAGTYSNFGGVVLPAQKLAILCWDGTWHLDIIPIASPFTFGAGTNSVQQKGTGAEASGIASVAEGGDNLQGNEPAEGEELLYAKAEGYASHAEGAAHAIGRYSHAEGGGNAIEEGHPTRSTAEGPYSHAEGTHTHAIGNGSHAEGHLTIANSPASHAEGRLTVAGVDQNNGKYAHAEGFETTASGQSSHAEGSSTTASGLNAHAEGSNNTASGESSHTEGAQTLASANHSHAGGFASKVSSPRGFAHGRNVEAKSNVEGQFVVGKYNKSNTNQIASVGIGTSDTARKNAFEIMSNGDVYVIGLGGYDGTNAGVAGVKTLQQLLSSLQQ